VLWSIAGELWRTGWVRACRLYDTTVLRTDCMGDSNHPGRELLSDAGLCLP
jgi:hypothetical protein